MNDSFPELKNAPIVEAVLDINCAMPPAFKLADIKAQAHQAFTSDYPQVRMQHIHKRLIEQNEKKSVEISAQHALQAMQFLKADEKQLVQVRRDGFSFNRLTPYTRLNDYLPEMERTWLQFIEIAKPVQIQAIKLRYINRISLEAKDGSVELDDYFKVGPKLPDEENLAFRGFLMQSLVAEKNTDNMAQIVLATESEKYETDVLSFIFDIGTSRKTALEVEDWQGILDAIVSLRQLKNSIFFNTLTSRCLEQFQK
jgi:uncharacterized protein (TIGR04255 family)